jgi:hypothetical protein
MTIEEAEQIRHNLSLPPNATAESWAQAMYLGALYPETGLDYWDIHLGAFAVLHAAAVTAERNRLLHMVWRLATHVGDAWGCDMDADCGECHLQKDDKSGCNRYDDAHYAMQALLKEAEEMLKEKP